MQVYLKTEFLKEVMIDRNWKSSDLARITNYSRGGMSRILNGKRNPSFKFIYGLLNALPEYEFDDLFFLSKV